MSFADTSDINDEGLFLELVSDLESALNVTHLDRSPGHSSVALLVVLLHVDRRVSSLIRLYVGLFVQLLSLSGIALVLNLGSELAADELLFLWGDGPGEFKSRKPVLKIHSHLESQFRLGALKESLLSQIVFEEDRSNVAN